MAAWRYIHLPHRKLHHLIRSFLRLDGDVAVES